jgi:hypothetical protein
MIRFPTEWKINPNVPNHQPGISTVRKAIGSTIHTFTMMGGIPTHPYGWLIFHCFTDMIVDGYLPTSTILPQISPNQIGWSISSFESASHIPSNS